MNKNSRISFITMLLVIFDVLAVNIAYFAALWFRFDCSFTRIPQHYLYSWAKFAPIYTVICIAVFLLLKMYRSVWRFAGFIELVRVAASLFITTFLHVVLITALFERMPVSYFCIGAMLQFLLVLCSRFANRFILLIREKRISGERSRIMLIGAGNAGKVILNDIRNTPSLREKVVCIIDDDPNKWHRYLDDVPIVGGRDTIVKNARKYSVDKIYLAIPSATAQQRKEILEICKDTECELKNLPGMYQLVSGELAVSQLKDVSVEDLLGREPIRADMTEVFEFLHDKVVMVTGGGGSIGSELCRQVASHDPKQLIIFDIYENSTYDIQNELKEKYPDLNLVVLIGSVRDSRRVFEVFEKYRPQIVYHAAAHKHVPLMEDSPNEAIKNNTIGTYKTAYAAMVHGCERFVLISTDKAVNPTSIMGASKRLCEMIIQSFDSKIKEGKANELPQLYTHAGPENADKDGTGRVFRNVKTEFVAVRFGNVLGSNGSVIQLFRKWIAQGGPVRVTHPDIIRYFMTIPEAVSLVLLAGTYAHGGEIFVLDMGSPVKIDDLARNMIRLSGYKPDVDIKIEYIGLRPGEKLYEEKLMAEEGLRKTANELIHIGNPIPFDVDVFMSQLISLMRAAYANKRTVEGMVERIVPTYHPYGNNIKIVRDEQHEERVVGH